MKRISLIKTGRATDERINTALKVRRIGEVTNQVCGNDLLIVESGQASHSSIAISVNIRTSCSVNLPAANR